MKIKNVFLVTLCVLSFAFAQNVYAATSKAPKNGPESFADLVETLTPAVVNISSTQKQNLDESFPEMPQFPEGSPFEDFFDEFMERRGRGPDAVPATSLGSGFVVDAKNGYVVTNNHVIRDAEQVRVTFYDDQTVDAEIIGIDEKTDIAVLKVDPQEVNLHEVPFGDSDIMRVGDWVVAIGNPFGLGGTVTAGILSARQRDINAGPYDDFLQTDASINRGNSGGPMFDLDGEVIGINTAIFSPTGGSVGIGFAIPSNLAKPIINQIVKYGRTRRGWLGVRIQTVSDEIAESLDLPETQGALVASLTDGGPAEAAGVQHGDIILKFNGSKIEDMKSLPRLVAETTIGDSVPVLIWRDGKEITLKVDVGELEKAEEDGLLSTGPRSEATAKKIETVGMSIVPLTAEEYKDYSIPSDVAGVVVSSVDPGSEAEAKGLEPGDVIVEMNQRPVKTPQEVIDIFDELSTSSRPSVLLLVNRSGNVRFVALKVK